MGYQVSGSGRAYLGLEQRSVIAGGAVITDGNRIVSLGYWRLRCGVEDRPERLSDRNAS